MTRTPKTLLIAGAAVAATSIGLLTFAQAQTAPPPGVDPATHAAHLRQNAGTHAAASQPDATGDANADLASQVAALRGEIAEIRAILTQQYAAPARANSGGNVGTDAMQKQPGGGQMPPQRSRQPGGMAGMSAGGNQPAAPGMAMGGKSSMQRPTGNSQSQPMQSMQPMQAQPGHPAPHVAAGGDYSDLVSQMAVMRADVSRLQAAIAQGHTAYAPTAASGGMAKGMGRMDTMDKMPMQSQPGSGGAGAGGMPGMSGSGQPAPGGMAPMQDDTMDMGGMPMMDDDMMEMGAMGGGAPTGAQPAAGGMPMMDDDMMPMGGMSGGAGGGGMGMDGMMKMMGMGNMPMGGAGSPAAMNMPSALPGFPGASHIYHIGATGFFLDHPEHITLTLEQQTALNQSKEQAMLQQAQFQRRVEEAEQELWVLTAADQPDAAAINKKVQEIARLRGDQRFAFIRAAGEAAKVLTDEQRRQLTGMLPPAPTPMAPAAPGMPAAGMSDM